MDVSNAASFELPRHGLPRAKRSAHHRSVLVASISRNLLNVGVSPLKLASAHAPRSISHCARYRSGAYRQLPNPNGQALGSLPVAAREVCLVRLAFVLFDEIERRLRGHGLNTHLTVPSRWFHEGGKPISHRARAHQALGGSFLAHPHEAADALLLRLPILLVLEALEDGRDVTLGVDVPRALGPRHDHARRVILQLLPDLGAVCEPSCHRDPQHSQFWRGWRCDRYRGCVRWLLCFGSPRPNMAPENLGALDRAASNVHVLRGVRCDVRLPLNLFIGFGGDNHCEVTIVGLDGIFQQRDRFLIILSQDCDGHCLFLLEDVVGLQNLAARPVRFPEPPPLPGFLLLSGVLLVFLFLFVFLSFLLSFPFSFFFSSAAFFLASFLLAFLLFLTFQVSSVSGSSSSQRT
mmetsp:Transcript_66466/g.188693  ORF Transcript_66466/g.188693 Transcript_66466/m.188693 type:complete len:406 (+) Transcript_66466:360-1577(+)